MQNTCVFLESEQSCFFLVALCKRWKDFRKKKNCSQSVIEVPNVKRQDQRVEGIGKHVFITSLLHSPIHDPSMILVGTNWTSRGGSGKTKLLRKKRGDSIEEDEDGEALQMLKNVPLKKKQLQQKKKRHPRR
jgi:hypothetical protein